MERVRLNEVISTPLSFQIDESINKTNEHILAIAKGEFFFPDGKSRNGRFYPKSLWEKQLAIPEVKERQKNRTMFGAVGHNVELTDETVGEGVASHFMTNLRIEEKDGKLLGLGEAYILNTPRGRVLNTLLRAGCKLCTSSRADGSYTNETYDGLQVVDPDTYQFYGFDFVIDPGFIKAMPSISESLKKNLDSMLDDLNPNKENLNKGDNTMSLENVLEKVTNERAQFKTDLERALDENKRIVKEMETHRSEVATITADLTSARTEMDKLLNEKKDLETKVTEITAVVEGYKKLGETTVIESKITELEKEIASYKEFGTTESMDKAISLAEKEIKKLRAEATAASVKLKAYEAIGTVEDVQKMSKFSNKLLDKIINEEEMEELEGLCVEFEIDKEKVQELIDSGLTLEQIKKVITSLSDAPVTVEAGDEDEPGEGDEPTNDEGDEPSALDRFEEPSGDAPVERHIKKKSLVDRNSNGTSAIAEGYLRVLPSAKKK